MSNPRVVPEYNSSMSDDNTSPNVPVSGLPELQAHLQVLVDDPSAPLEAKLFDDVELQLNETNIPPLLPSLLPPLTTVLKQTSQDPSPLLSLAIKLLSPLSFARCLTIADPTTLITALRSPLPGANLLALAILHKAASSPSEAAILSTLPDVVEEVLLRWLDSPDTGVGERAARVLGDILETDCEIVDGEGVNGIASTNGAVGTEVVKRRVPGHGRVWRVIFGERSFQALITSHCGPETPANQRTIAQGRVLRLLPRLTTINPRAVSQTPFPELFPLPSALVEGAGQGLLQWAALGMADHSDILMVLTLEDFFEAFVSIMRVAGSTPDKEKVTRDLVTTATQNNQRLGDTLRSLPNRTVEEEAEPLRRYISQLLE